MRFNGLIQRKTATACAHQYVSALLLRRAGSRITYTKSNGTVLGNIVRVDAASLPRCIDLFRILKWHPRRFPSAGMNTGACVSEFEFHRNLCDAWFERHLDFHLNLGVSRFA
jgi:hypothetical protein